MDLFEERDAVPPARPNSLVHPSLDEPVPFANSFLPEAVLAPMPGDSLSELLPHHEPLTRGEDSSLLLHNEGLPASSTLLSRTEHEHLPLGGALGGLGAGALSSFGGLEPPTARLSTLPVVSSSSLPSTLLGGSELLGAGGLHREAVPLCSDLEGPLLQSGVPHLHLQQQQPGLVEAFAPLSLQAQPGPILTSDMAGVPPPPPLDSSMPGVPPPPPIPGQTYTGQLQTANFDQAIHSAGAAQLTDRERALSSYPHNGGNFAAAAPPIAGAGVTNVHEEKKHESFIDRLKEKKHIHDLEKAEERREKEIEKEQKETEKELEKEFKQAGFAPEVAKTLSHQQPPLQQPILTNAMPGVPPPPPRDDGMMAPPTTEAAKPEKKHRSLKELFHRHKKEDKENVGVNH